MRVVFADTGYWIAVLGLTGDQYETTARSAKNRLGAATRLLTTEEVLTEFLNFFGGKGGHSRSTAGTMVDKILSNPNVEVLPQTRESFRAGLAFYKRRADKGYSLTDCISMVSMERRSIREVLTTDHHFRQEGFTDLMHEESQLAAGAPSP